MPRRFTEIGGEEHVSRVQGGLAAGVEDRMFIAHTKISFGKGISAIRVSFAVLQTCSTKFSSCVSRFFAPSSRSGHQTRLTLILVKLRLLDRGGRQANGQCHQEFAFPCTIDCTL